MRYLKDNGWGTTNAMPWENVTQIFEFVFYMLLLKGKLRSGTQEIDYSAGDELTDFCLKLKAKSNMTSGIAALRLDPTSRTDTATAKSTETCSYCNKRGHSKTHCFARRREKRKGQS